MKIPKPAARPAAPALSRTDPPPTLDNAGRVAQVGDKQGDEAAVEAMATAILANDGAMGEEDCRTTAYEYARAIFAAILRGDVVIPHEARVLLPAGYHTTVGNCISAFAAKEERLREKIENQRQRIVYLEGATNHAEGTPLTRSIKECERLKSELERVRNMKALGPWVTQDTELEA